MIRVAEGMAAWASFAQATFLSPVYSEALTYRPIFEITRPREWRPFPQKKIAKRTRKLGRNQTVDFAFHSNDNRTGIFLEVKFIRKKGTHCVQISKDIRKLVLLDGDDISKRNPPKHVFRFILLIGTRKDIQSRIEKYKNEIRKSELKKLAYTEDPRLATQVKSAFDNSLRQAKNLEAWSFAGLGNDRWKYWAVLLKEQSWWKDLSKLTGKLPDEDEETDEGVPNTSDDDAEGNFDA